MREKLAGDSNQHQPPHVVADLIGKIISEAPNYPNGSNVIVSASNVSFESK
jgi:hypothetical protein